MKFGVNKFLWSASFGPEQFYLLPKLKEQGFDGIEIPLIDPESFGTARFRRELERYGLEATVCSVLPGHLSLISPDGIIRRRTQDHPKRCIELTAELGASVLAGPLYSPVGYLPGRRRTSEEWTHAVEGYRELGPVLASSNVVLAIEAINRFETYFHNTIGDAVALCAEVRHPNVGILFDTFHDNIEEKNIADALAAAVPYLSHVHTCENDRGIPGTGHVPRNEVFRVLRDARYDRWLTIESFGFALPELSSAASIWRDLAPTPESIASEGVRFLARECAGGTAVKGRGASKNGLTTVRDTIDTG